MKTALPVDASFPLTDAMLIFSPECIERTRRKLEYHGATFEPQGNDTYKVLFPAGTRCREIRMRQPQQHRILFPDGFSFVVINPPHEEEKQEKYH